MLLLLVLIKSFISDNCKNIFLVLGVGPTDDINDSVGAAETNFNINFTEGNMKFSLSLLYSGDESYLYVNETKISKFYAHINIPWYAFFKEVYQKILQKLKWSKFQ